MPTICLSWLGVRIDFVTPYVNQGPGGWNRIQVEVADLEAVVEVLRDHGTTFRNDIVTGRGGKQVLVEDPSGNLVELLKLIREEARLDSSSE